MIELLLHTTTIQFVQSHHQYNIGQGLALTTTLSIRLHYIVCTIAPILPKVLLD